ncbi:SDR family NAD(P)-dependent oxidoreductase [Rhodococcus spelaei]|uniref:SDR family NAD(P)-dependent oxidoreductase n=1 Tax=Rhodococcus spelaei TaxID=2546320 RepID=A0A541B0G3_9NOCA|nr:SDR family NAD(P)-dependent oxidoreductase [Rhodococcus spelaei]TQF65813.1 SDR family NAD(P)-dependent oxidoreductase [Rhodococcus spelaei]
MSSGPDSGLAGRGAVVTGSSRGIGRAVAFALAAEGAGVVVNGRDPAAAEQTAADIVAAGGRAVAVPGSAAADGVAEALADAAVRAYGSVDVLVNCAGVAEPPGSSILTISDDQWREQIDAHLTSTFRTCRVMAPLMVERGAGAIVNTSSFAFLGDYGGTGYPAGKGAVNSLTLAIAAELAQSGVRANVVCPGASTRLSVGDEYVRHIEDLHRRGMLDDAMRHGSLNPAPAQYVATLYAFLASDLSAGVTGGIFAGSGGFVGRFDRQTPALVAYRDHLTAPPWTLDELAGQLS